MTQSKLFSPITLRGLELPNRIAVSPMCQYEAEDGSATDWHLAHLGQLALGGAGLLIVEATAVSRVGRITHGCLGLYSDANERALRRVVELCRQYGVSKLAIQLGHAGRKGSTHVPLKGNAPLKPGEDPWTTEAPSALAYGEGWHTPAALDEAGLARTLRDFVQATERAERLGFELIELHAAHGYLLHEFLSPISNRRTDQYGGAAENRMRFPLEVFAACRAVWPAHKPMGIRVSATDWVEGGWTPEETVAMAKRLKTLGCDYVDVSSAGLDPRQKLQLGPGYQAHFAEQVKREAGIPTMAVGMITDAHQAEQIIASGQADMVALARAMLLNPRWAWFAAQELGAQAAMSVKYARAEPKNWPQAFPQKKAAE
jgi:2,4-dienoyl-CoA reductase-like NADH-dependent reductase (Old Yellow Enzyme family)